MKKMGGGMSGAAARTGSSKVQVNKKYYKKLAGGGLIKT